MSKGKSEIDRKLQKLQKARDLEIIMKKVKIYQRAKTGKVKFIEVWTEGNELVRQWGTTDSKVQETRKQCEAKNSGRSNATTAEEQAIVEMGQLLERKKKEGYVESLDDVNETAVVEVDLENLPKEFCPSKPHNKATKKILESEDTYAQRKHDGHCILLLLTDKKARVFSRRMEDITDHMEELPFIQDAFANMDEGSLIVCEVVYQRASDGKELTRPVAKLVRKKDREAVLQRYHEFSVEGDYKLYTFDIMYHEYKFCGDMKYKSRLGYISFNLQTPEIIEDWKEKEDEAQEKKWEGFILRNDTIGSEITYSLNGKADRSGAYKYKFLGTDDFIVVGAQKGTSGKHRGLYATFNLQQYLSSGEAWDCGNCGAGKLSHDVLREITEQIDAGEITFPFVIEVEYQEREEDSLKMKFPQFVRIREDKTPEECICELEPEE